MKIAESEYSITPKANPAADTWFPVWRSQIRDINYSVPSLRLEDRIRELCSKAVSSDETELTIVLSELRSAMREHVERIRTLAVRQLAGERPRGDETRE